MTYQEGQVGQLITYTPPNSSDNQQLLGQIVGGDGTLFDVEVFRVKPFSGMQNPGISVWLAVTPYFTKLNPLYCRGSVA